MNYYKLCFDYNNKKKYICCDDGEFWGMSEFDPLMGKSLRESWITPTLFYDSNELNFFSDNLFNVYNWFVVSDRFAQFLHELSNDSFELLDVNIVDRASGLTNKNYKVVNIIKILDAINLDYSDYDTIEYNGEKLLFIKKFSLNEEKIHGANIFKVKTGRMPIEIFVSEIVKNFIKKNKITGFDFAKVMTI